MPLGKNSKVMQVIVSKEQYNYIKLYSKLLNESMSEICNIAISRYIFNDKNNIKLGDEIICTD